MITLNKRTMHHWLVTALFSGALAACTGIAPAADMSGSPTQGEATAGDATAVATTAPDATAESDGTAATAAADLPTPQPTSQTNAATVTPLDAAECEEIRATLAAQLNAEFTMEEAIFASGVANQQGTACTLTATGTGEDFGHFVDVAQNIRDTMAAAGWTENVDYLADGPTGTASGYEQEGKLALVQVGWEPADEDACPEEQPISACELEPSQQLFTIVVELVQTS